jgi:hypothetical protein
MVMGECCGLCVPDGTAGNGSAGYGGCGVVACPLIACGSNETLVTEPGQCCPSCIPSGSGGAGGTQSGGAGGAQSGGAGGFPQWGGAAGQSAGAGGDAGIGGGLGCGGVLCPGLACVKGYISVKEPGACCATCVADSQACTAGEQGYQTLRTSLLQQSGATSCSVDTDCTNLGGVPQCGDQCVSSAVNASLAPDMASQLSLWASNYCSTCTAAYPPCALPPTPFCSAGQCQLYHTL